ncbi:ribonuclease H-like domain-containing protein [Tanacetum coccineum]
MVETMEQYMSKTRADYGLGVVRPKIEDKDNFELKGQFLKELRTNTIIGSDHEDANEHIEKVLEIVDLFHIPNITIDEVMLRSFPMSLTRAASRCLRNKPTGSITTWEELKTKLQKIVSQLAILGENISQEDLNLKFLRSLSAEWNTHVNCKLYSSSSLRTLALCPSLALLMKCNTALWSYQPNGSQLVHKDLEQIHKVDLEEMDLKWQLALLSMRTRKFFQKTGRKITINGSDTTRYDKSKVECFNCHKLGHFARECKGPRNQDNRSRNQDSSRRTINVKEISSKAMLAIDGAGFDWSFMADEEVPTDMALMAFSDSKLVLSVEVLTMCRLTAITIKGKGWPKVVNTARPNSAVVNAVRANQVNVVKASAWNMSYLLDFKEFDGGYVAFGGGAKRGRITGKGTLKTVKAFRYTTLELESRRKLACYVLEEKPIIASPTVPTALLESTYGDSFGDESELDLSNIATTYPVPTTPNTRIHKDHSLDHVLGDKPSWCTNKEK